MLLLRTPGHPAAPPPYALNLPQSGLQVLGQT